MSFQGDCQTGRRSLDADGRYIDLLIFTHTQYRLLIDYECRYIPITLEAVARIRHNKKIYI